MNGNNGNILDRCEVDKLMASVYKDLRIAPKEVHIDTGSNKGDGYMSFMTRVDIVCEDGTPLHLILKSAPRIPEFRNMAPIHDAYLCEMYFYEVVVPTFYKFQTDHHDVAAPFRSSVKYYSSCRDDGAEVLVMENIKLNGFQLWDRMKLMDHAHIALVLRTYAKYHAISYAMQQQQPAQYAELIAGMPEVFTFKKITDDTIFQMFQSAVDKVCEQFKESNAELHEYLKTFSAYELFKSMDGNVGKHPVICHGDCWVNNMMFKYDDPKHPDQPTDIRLLDFQIMKIGSPVLDLSYFFYVSAPKDILLDLDSYLRLYYDALCENLREMDVHVVKMSFEDLKQEWKEYAKMGYILALSVSKIMMCEQDEVIDFAAMAVDKSFVDAFSKEMKHEDFINNKLQLLTQHMWDNGFF